MRPSRLGSGHLSVTWKVSDGVFANVAIRELGLPRAGGAVSPPLKVDGVEYSELDEVIDAHIRALHAYFYFRP